MFSAEPLSLLRVVIAYLLAIAIACAPPLNMVAHNPALLVAAEAERHAALGDAGASDDDHGHSHDDGDTHEQRPGHLHGHDASDHTHDTGHAGLTSRGIEAQTASRKACFVFVQQDDGLIDPLERPPRALS